MKNYSKLAILAVLFSSCFLLTGCVIKPYRIDVQQGNVVDAKAVQQVRLGMTKDVVESILGTPMLDSVFEDNCWTYVYTNQINGGKIEKKEINLHFDGDKLVSIK